jgi:hypothetical protein
MNQKEIAKIDSKVILTTILEANKLGMDVSIYDALDQTYKYALVFLEAEEKK